MGSCEFVDYGKKYFEEVKDGLNNTLVTTGDNKLIEFEMGLMCWVDEAYKRKNKRGIFFFCGNGASATMAEHLSSDCFQNAGFITQTVSETSYLTAISNDVSYEEVFSYRIGRILGEKDMLITISSSGNSLNIVKAIHKAREVGAYVVTLSGKGKDNVSRKNGDLNFYVPLDTYGTIESAHAILLHCWLDMYMDKYLSGRH